MPNYEGGGESWSLLIDTNNIPDSTSEAVFKFGSIYQVTGKSHLLFAANPG